MTLSVNIQKVNLLAGKESNSILEQIQFELQPEKIYTILGKNGSGKSTLIKSLTNLLDKSIYQIIGTVFYNGKNLFELSEKEIQLIRQQNIRYVLQDLTNNFDPLKKLKYYFDLISPEKEKVKKHLSEFLLPDYNKISALYPYEISGGIAQRLSLLFAIISQPKILILDEPTSAVDYVNMNLIKLKLTEYVNSGNTVLMVTQDVNFAKNVSDEIAFLEKGKLSGFATKKDFFNSTNTNAYKNFISSFQELQ